MDPSLEQKLTQLHQAHVDELHRKVAAVLLSNGYDALVIHSGTPSKRTLTDDIYWPLRPTPEFHHWIPLSEAGCVLSVEPGKRPRLLRPVVVDFWEAPLPAETSHFWSAFDVVDVRDAKQLRELMPRGRVAFLGDDLAAAHALGIGEEHRNPKDLTEELDELRVHKTPYEITCLAEANRRAALGHEELRRLFASGDHSELTLHLSFLAATRQDDWETPYKNIVALDQHAATLHHVSYGKKAHAAHTLLVDAAAGFAGYCADITRTWVRGRGAVVDAFAQLVDGVERMQQRLCMQARIGMPYESLHDEAHRQVAAILREVGVGRASEAELVEGGITRAFFPHGLGHSLGLVCHDVGCGLIPPRAENPFLRNTSTISEKQVFTIEPGIYFIESLLAPVRSGPRAAAVDWTLVDQLAKLGGVRIEDDVVMEAHGLRNLTREVLPKGGGMLSPKPEATGAAEGAPPHAWA